MWHTQKDIKHECNLRWEAHAQIQRATQCKPHSTNTKWSIICTISIYISVWSFSEFLFAFFPSAFLRLSDCVCMFVYCGRVSYWVSVSEWVSVSVCALPVSFHGAAQHSAASIEPSSGITIQYQCSAHVSVFVCVVVVIVSWAWVGYLVACHPVRLSSFQLICGSIHVCLCVCVSL